MDSPTRAMLQADPLPPIVPNRFREPLYHVADDALDESVGADMGKWLYDHRDRLVRGGDDDGIQRFNYEIINMDQHAADLIQPLTKKLIELCSSRDVLDALCVPEFDLRYVETHATLYHHGSHFIWHDDVPGYDGEVVPSRRVTFCYYLHSDPKMFAGGELEFLNGEKIEPKNNRIVLFHPVQQHRVRKVECWSGHLLHGRWAMVGWIHGDPPDGWVDRLPQLRGIPSQG